MSKSYLYPKGTWKVLKGAFPVRVSRGDFNLDGNKYKEVRNVGNGNGEPNTPHTNAQVPI